MSPFNLWIPTSTSMPENFNFLFQRNELYVDEDYQMLLLFKKQIYPGKNFHTKNSVFEMNIHFLTKGTKYIGKKTINFCHLSKTYSDKNFHLKKFQCLKLNTIFSHKGTKCIRKKTINICHRLQNVSQQVCPCQKNSVFEIEYILFQSKERNVSRRRLIFFVTLKKNFLPTKLPCQKVNQRKEMYVKEE